MGDETATAAHTVGDPASQPFGEAAGERVSRLTVLVNAAAGSVDDAALAEELDAIRSAFAEADPSVDVEVDTVEPAELVDTVKDIWAGADRPDAVVVAGGDGTVNCAAGPAMEDGIVLGVLPRGTFNHFAKDLGMPADDLAASAKALVEGVVRQVDVAEVNGRPFVNNSVLGIYPDMVAVRDRIRDQRGWGKVRAVPVAAWRVLRAFPVHRLDLVGPNFVRHRVRTPLVFIGNGTYGDDDADGVVARGSLDDGVLDVAIARVISRWRLAATLLRTLISGGDAARDLDRTSLTEVTVSAHVRHLRVALDGEIVWMQSPLRYRVRPGGLRVLAPPVADSTTPEVAAAAPSTDEPASAVPPAEVGFGA
jgi:diacylglycerol kinase family enzyme